jgi:hypothetical protein
MICIIYETFNIKGMKFSFKWLSTKQKQSNAVLLLELLMETSMRKDIDCKFYFLKTIPKTLIKLTYYTEPPRNSHDDDRRLTVLRHG